MKENVNRKDLSKGLQIARFSFVILALISLGSALSSAFTTGPFSYLPTLLSLAFIAGLVICLKASPGTGTPWIVCSLVCLVISIGLAFVPKMALLGHLAFLGEAGFVLAGLLYLIMPFVAFTFFLVYLKVLAVTCEQPKIGFHFLRLSFVPVAILALMAAGIFVLPAELALLAPLSAMVLGLVLVISFSGAVGTLVQRLV